MDGRGLANLLAEFMLILAEAMAYPQYVSSTRLNGTVAATVQQRRSSI